MNIDVDLSPIGALIIDDSRYARSFIKSALQSFGIRKIFEAADGPSGIEILGREPIQLVIVDHDMAPMDGIDFTRLVRAGDILACDDVAIIMMSAESATEVVIQARSAGVNEFLVKPMSTDSLYRRIRNAMVNPKAFVRTASFRGPDRRLLARPPQGTAERREAPPLAKPRSLVVPLGGPTVVAAPRPAMGAVPGAVAKPAQERTGRRKFAAGTVVFNEGDAGDMAYVVESGRVGIFKTVEGRRVALGQINVNGIFGEMALIDNEPRMASAVALEDSVCLVIPMAALKAQIGKTPDLVILVLETLLYDIRKMGRELGQVRAAIEQRRTGRG